jgi:hypothetical protein
VLVEKATTDGQAQLEAVIQRKVDGKAATVNIAQAWGRGGLGSTVQHIHNFDATCFLPGNKGLLIISSYLIVMFF